MAERMSVTSNLYNVPKLEALVQLYLAKYFWDLDYIRRIEEHGLFEYRENAINRISRLQNLPTYLLSYLEQGVLLLEQAYRQATEWQNIYCNVFCDEFKNCDCSNYYVTRYFTVDGNFNDVAWVKRYVNDELRSPYSCFLFDCFYGIEDKIFLHWQVLKSSGFDPSGANLHLMRNGMPFLIVLWIYKLENNLEELIQIGSAFFYTCSTFFIDNVHKFWYAGFINAVWNGHEHATYYFWRNMSDAEKESFVQNNLTNCMSRAAQASYYRIVNFLYSLLSDEQKSNLLIKDRDMLILDEDYLPLHRVWHRLIVSPFSHSTVIKDILEFPYIPARVLSYIILIYELTCSLKHFRLPKIRKAFLAIWQKLSEEDKLSCIENEDFLILKRLVSAEELDIVGLIIKGMSSNVRMNCLRDNWMGAGIGNLDILRTLKKYSLLGKYLLFFLMQLDTDIIREDASSILLSLTLSHTFRNWIQNLNELEQYEVTKVILNLIYIIIQSEANQVIDAYLAYFAMS